MPLKEENVFKNAPQKRRHPQIKFLLEITVRGEKKV